MKKPVLTSTIAAALLTLPFAATAGSGYTSGVLNTAQDDWAQEAFYDACMNGDVSASGMFSSQLAEDKAIARMGLTNATDS